MSYISASRMPHAYADPASEAEGDVGTAVQGRMSTARDVASGISRGIWMLGALGVGAVGALLYATLRPGKPAQRKRRSAGRKPAARRGKAA